MVICKFDEMPYSEFMIKDFEIGVVFKVYSSVVKVDRKFKDYYHTTMQYDNNP